ncbi:MAG: hypothetical protein ABSD99_03460 [Candidatus Bathyarchaeia archaeon]|jgi:hypothetical protein
MTLRATAGYSSTLCSFLPFSTKLLDVFDLTILSQAFTAGELLTEVDDLLDFRSSDQFTKNPLSKSIKITRWKEIAARQTE